MSNREPYPYSKTLDADDGIKVYFSHSWQPAGKNGEARQTTLALINVTGKSGKVYNYMGIAARKITEPNDPCMGQRIALKRACESMYNTRLANGDIEDPDGYTFQHCWKWLRTHLFTHAVKDHVWDNPEAWYRRGLLSEAEYELAIKSS